MNANKHTAQVRGKAMAGNLSSMALSFALPHENKPIRLPVIPAVHTSVLDVMSDGTVSIADNTSKRFVLCRDPCYPLWGDVVVSYCAVGLLAVGSATTWNLPAKANATLALPVFETTYSGGAGPSFDGTFVSLATSIDRGVIVGDAPGTLACYIPTGSTFFLWITTSAAAGGTGIEFEVVSQRGMEEIVSTLTAVVSGNTYLFSGIAGTTTVINGTLGEGIIPAGFS